MSGFIGTKIGMTQVFGANGELIPVTVLAATPCTVVQVRTRGTDGYEAIQLGFGSKRERLVRKPLRGHMAKAKTTPSGDATEAADKPKAKVGEAAPGASTFAGLIEFRVSDASSYQVGQELKVGDVFKAGDRIDVCGVTKGKGYQGVVRRYGFKGQTATRGTHESFRGPGSVGNRSFPGRIFKGKRMDGHMGSVRRTTQNLVIVDVRGDDGLVLVRGGIPGAAGQRVVLQRATKRRVATPAESKGQGKKKAS